jgi:ABC-type antimicrobial peptide transport system permease subunit
LELSLAGRKKLKEEEILSPGRLAWLRLKRNRSAMFGLYTIIIAVFLALFCFFLVPDASPDSNRMSLPVSLQRPGSRIAFLKIPNHREKENSVLHSLFFGSSRCNLLSSLCTAGRQRGIN